MALWSFLTQLPSRFISQFYLKNSRILECQSPANTNQAPVFNYFAAAPSSSTCNLPGLRVARRFPIENKRAPTAASLMKRTPQRIQPSGNRRQTPTAQRQRLHVIRRVLRNALHRLQTPDNLETRHGLFAGGSDNSPIELIDLRDVAVHRLQRRRQLTVLDTGP